MTCERAADLLDAYLDGEADALNTRMLEDHLAECATCSRQLAARQALQKALREKLSYHRAPLPLRHTAPIRPAWRRALLYPLAAGLLLLAGLGIGYNLQPRPPASDPLLAMVQDAEMDHLRSLQEGHLLDVVSSDKHTVKPWFAGKLAFSPAVPDPPGFPLRGGRLDWIEGRQAAALVYGRDKHTINLLIWPSDNTPLPATPTPRTTAAGHHVSCWSEGGLNFCAISDLEAGQLADFAATYRAAAQP